jgi:hypothetical protein
MFGSFLSKMQVFLCKTGLWNVVNDQPQLKHNARLCVHVDAALLWHAVNRTERSERRGVFALVV